MALIKKIMNGRTAIKGFITDIMHEELMSLVRVVKDNPETIKEENLTQLQKMADIMNGLVIEAAKGYAKVKIEEAMDKNKK